MWKILDAFKREGLYLEINRAESGFGLLARAAKPSETRVVH